MSKVLRWVVASVILGRISNEFYHKKTDFCFGLSSCTTLESTLEFFTTREDNIGEEELFASEALAFMILYLQQLLGRSCVDLPSVIFALCLLLISDGSSKLGMHTFPPSAVSLFVVAIWWSILSVLCVHQCRMLDYFYSFTTEMLLTAWYTCFEQEITTFDFAWLYITAEFLHFHFLAIKLVFAFVEYYIK